MIYPNPRHLRAFVALAETGSFGLAAEAVHVGQPALSQAIVKLEELVGVRLIERTTRSVGLTPAGAEFLVNARRVLDANEVLMRSGSEWAQVRRGRLEILSIPSMAHRLLPAVISEFARRHADITIEVHDHADPVLRRRLDHREGDLAIVTHSGDAGGHVALPFLRDRFRVVISAGHPFARQETVEAAQLAGQRLILLRRGAAFRSYMDAAISALTLAHAPIEVDQPATLNGMVEAGLGVALLPALYCPTPALRSVVTRPLVRPEVWRLIAFVQPREREPMPAVQEFVRIALDFLAKSGARLPEGCELLPVSAQRVKNFFSPAPRSSRPKGS